MTTIESVVTSLDWSKKLKEAGWPQEFEVEGKLATYGYCIDTECNCEELHLIHHDNDEGGTVGNDYSHRLQDYEGRPHAFLLAPTAEEILRRLPDEIPINAGLKGSDYWIEIAKSSHWGSTPWEIRYRENGTLLLWDNPEPIRGSTLANAAAAMYCYLAEQGLLPTSA